MTEADKRLGVEVCKRFPVDLADVQGIIEFIRGSLRSESTETTNATPQGQPELPREWRDAAHDAPAAAASGLRSAVAAPINEEAVLRGILELIPQFYHAAVRTDIEALLANRSTSSATAETEGYPGIAHDLEEMRKALESIKRVTGQPHVFDIAKAALAAADRKNADG